MWQKVLSGIPCKITANFFFVSLNLFCGIWTRLPLMQILVVELHRSTSRSLPCKISCSIDVHCFFLNYVYDFLNKNQITLIKLGNKVFQVVVNDNNILRKNCNVKRFYNSMNFIYLLLENFLVSYRKNVSKLFSLRLK